MSTPKDRQRTKAFRAWVAHVGGAADAQLATGISARTIERMTTGRQPPPIRLLEQLADALARDGGADQLADALASAASPAEPHHA